MPDNAITESLLAVLKGLGVDTSPVLLRKQGRLGIYFLETGANQRGSNVIYDRDGSAIALAAPAEYDFAAALKDVHWVHITGITPSLSENAFLSTLELVRLANSTESELDRRLKIAVAMAEPAMLFLIAAFIGTIFIGMVIPIFTLQDYIK